MCNIIVLHHGGVAGEIRCGHQAYGVVLRRGRVGARFSRPDNSGSGTEAATGYCSKDRRGECAANQTGTSTERTSIVTEGGLTRTLP